MMFDIVGFFAGMVVADTIGLKDTQQAAKVALLPGIMGLSVVSLLATRELANREVESLSPPPKKPEIAVTPNIWDFGSTAKVGTSTNHTFVVVNNGNAELVVNATTVSGTDANQFIIASKGSFTVVPGARHDVVVGFTPKVAGAKSAILEIASNSPDQSTVQINLSGTATK